MSLFNDYFDGKIFCINVAARTDRWEHACRLFKKFDIPAIRFDAYSGIKTGTRIDGNAGCTASHRALLEVIAFNRWPRALVLEDDFDIIYEDFHERFERFIYEVPQDWGLIYLGGGYSEPPIRRVSKHVIQTAGMMTTSSYGITWQQARKMAPYIFGAGPIDSLFQGFNREAPSYCISPRCVVQFPNVSDLQGREMDNSASMLDCAMESSLT